MKLLPILEDGVVDSLDIDKSEIVESVLEATVATYRREGFAPPWTGYLALEAGKCVGACGFTGPPKGGEVEVAYFTFPGNEGTGVASRMATELVRIGQDPDNGLESICAHTLPGEGSIHVNPSQAWVRA
jgi:RimJ/RimL family protein N-acetyltransferase